MATYTQALPALSNSLFRLKGGSRGSKAIAFALPVSAASDALDTAFPAWLGPTIQAFTDLLQLPRNWDGYGAVQVREPIVRKALLMLVGVMEDDAPAPSVVPLSDGGIQVEWHRRGRNLEIEFPAIESPSFYYYEDGSEVESEGQVSRSYDRIQAHIANVK